MSLTHSAVQEPSFWQHPDLAEMEQDATSRQKTLPLHNAEAAEWKKDLCWSNKAFVDLVWPIISKDCGGGDIKPVEIIKDNTLATDLDLLCGIDVWQTISGRGCVGIASRVQVDCGWHTFTVRNDRKYSKRKTEYQKRKEAIASCGQFIYPFLSCHAYVNKEKNKVVRIGLCKTVDLINAIDRGDWFQQTTGTENFYCVYFNRVKDVRVYFSR